VRDEGLDHYEKLRHAVWIEGSSKRAAARRIGNRSADRRQDGGVFGAAGLSAFEATGEAEKRHPERARVLRARYSKVAQRRPRFEFPVFADKFPVPSKKFPVPLSREFYSKPLNLRDD